MKVQIEKFDDSSYTRREAFNSLRTNLSFCGDDNKVILVTSTVPDEGKSSICMELGMTLAKNEKKVLLIDADLRKSVLIGRHFVKSEEGEIKGLSHYISGQNKMEEVICDTNIENFSIVFAGHITPNPTELLGNKYFKELVGFARENYDIVLIDAPPLGLVIDAAVIAPNADGVILVIEAEKCNYKQVKSVKKQLDMAGIRTLGAVLNKTTIDKKSYYAKYYSNYLKED